MIVATKNSRMQFAIILNTQNTVHTAEGKLIATSGDRVLCLRHTKTKKGWKPGFTTLADSSCSSLCYINGRKVAKVGTRTVCGHSRVLDGSQFLAETLS